MLSYLVTAHNKKSAGYENVVASQVQGGDAQFKEKHVTVSLDDLTG